MDYRNADAAAPVEQPLVGGDDAGRDVRGGRHGCHGQIEMAAMQVDRNHGGLGMIDTEVHNAGHSRGLHDVFSKARWSMPKRSASQSASTSWPMVGLSCWQCSAPVSSGSSTRSVASTPC